MRKKKREKVKEKGNSNRQKKGITRIYRDRLAKIRKRRCDLSAESKKKKRLGQLGIKAMN